MADASDLLTILPELDLISDADLRTKAIAVWSTLANQSKFRRLMDVPVLPTLDYPQITHNRSVAAIAMKVAEILEQFHGVQINRDVLLTAALLQDVSKLVEYEPVDGKVDRSEIGNSFQHGFFGAHSVLTAGLPLEIAESVLDHTYASSRFPRTLISKILFYVDQIDAAALHGDRWKKISVIYR